VTDPFHRRVFTAGNQLHWSPPTNNITISKNYSRKYKIFADEQKPTLAEATDKRQRSEEKDAKNLN